jgi:hypothetical protein
MAEIKSSRKTGEEERRGDGDAPKDEERESRVEKEMREMWG